ncbi:TetR/AcrR family transcriptional regulator [Leifsonia sp. NPDC058230]|uniref:TetR/AcrR family transcriptional regulator n=1 Tax=Leifsonia sp. NPDC058230 TaxID=3346391 RepID=UPI0036DAA201
MPKVSEEHRTARRTEIAGAALRCFARKGFQATSMADIIAESGLSAGAIYGHYKSKEQLIELAIADVLDGRFLDLADARRHQPIPDPGAVVGMLVHGIEGQIGTLSLLVQVWGQVVVDPKLHPLMSSIGTRVRTMLTAYLTDWYATALGHDPEKAAELAARYAPLYVGIVQGYVVQSTIFADFDRSAYLAAASGIRPS